MSRLLLVNESMRVVVEQIFGKILLCRSFPIALKAAKIHSVNCVTLEGDKVSA
jgi:chromosome segregation ATPase